MHRSDRKDGRMGGGVAVFVRHNVPCVRLSAMESANFETVWLLYRQSRIPRSVSHVVIGAVYHPPAADDRAMASHILECLDTVVRDTRTLASSCSAFSTSYATARCCRTRCVNNRHYYFIKDCK